MLYTNWECLTQTGYAAHRLGMCNFENPDTDVMDGNEIGQGCRVRGRGNITMGMIIWERT